MLPDIIDITFKKPNSLVINWKGGRDGEFMNSLSEEEFEAYCKVVPATGPKSTINLKDIAGLYMIQCLYKAITKKEMKGKFTTSNEFVTFLKNKLVKNDDKIVKRKTLNW